MVNFGITYVIDLMDLLNRLNAVRMIEEMKIDLYMCAKYLQSHRKTKNENG